MNLAVSQALALLSPLICCGQIFQIDQFRVQIHRALFKEPTTGQNLLNSCFFDAVVHHIFGQRVVQIDGHFASQ